MTHFDIKPKSLDISACIFFVCGCLIVFVIMPLGYYVKLFQYLLEEPKNHRHNYWSGNLNKSVQIHSNARAHKHRRNLTQTHTSMNGWIPTAFESQYTDCSRILYEPVGKTATFILEGSFCSKANISFKLKVAPSPLTSYSGSRPVTTTAEPITFEASANSNKSFIRSK